MSNRFFIGDTHLGHAKIITLQVASRKFDTIEEHDEAIVDRWNSVVGKKDSVWHLGDVAFTKDSLKHVGRLNGTKKLILGNHDNYHAEEYLKYFKDVYGTLQLKDGLVLTHVPIHLNEFKKRWSFNIHGHVHKRRWMPEYVIRERDALVSAQLIYKGNIAPDDLRYINVCADHTGLTPVSWDSLFIGKKETFRRKLPCGR